MEGTRGGVAGDFGHGGWDVGLAGLSLENWAALQEVCHFVNDEWDVGLEGLGGESDLHELGAVSCAQE